MRSGEDVLLLENSADVRMWKVRNGRGQESDVPSTIVLIPGPCSDAVDAAVRFSQLQTANISAIQRLRVGRFLPEGGKNRFFPWKKPDRQK